MENRDTCIKEMILEELWIVDNVFYSSVEFCSPLYGLKSKEQNSANKINTLWLLHNIFNTVNEG